MDRNGPTLGTTHELPQNMIVYCRIYQGSGGVGGISRQRGRGIGLNNHPLKIVSFIFQKGVYVLNVGLV